MKLLGTFLLSFVCGLAAFTEPVVLLVESKKASLEVTDTPSLVAPASLKTNKAGRARFEVKTNCKAVVYLVDEEQCELDRVFTAPDQFVYRFAADNPGVFRVVFVAAQGDTPVIAQTVITYEGSNPNPPPPTPVPPGPTPQPPGPVSKLYIVVIEETGAAHKGRAAFYGQLAVKLKDKKHVLKVEDKDVKNAAGQTPPDLAPYIKAAAGKEPYVFLVDETGKVRHEGVLPAAVADLLAIIQKVGG